jgi:hypothetical protein
MNFEEAIIRMPDGQEQRVSHDEFMTIPLSERIELMTASRIKFFRDGQPISPIEAVRRAR